MRERLFLGIDGGGTTTRARLTDAAGRILGEGFAGSSNLNMGAAPAHASILAATRGALQDAGLPDSRISDIWVGFGLAGANVPERAAAFLAIPMPFTQMALASDAVTACLGAHDGEDGAILILGTGSQGLALINGEMHTVGGWGFELSDDGSGAILGRSAIRAAIRSLDGLAPASNLTRAVMARFPGGAAEAAVWGKSATPADYGAFAPLVVEHFASGDPIAVELMRRSSNRVDRLLKRLADLGAQRISLMGGLAQVHAPLIAHDLQHLIVPPKGDAMDGALSLIRQKVMQ